MKRHCEWEMHDVSVCTARCMSGRLLNCCTCDPNACVTSGQKDICGLLLDAVARFFFSSLKPEPGRYLSFICLCTYGGEESGCRLSRPVPFDDALSPYHACSTPLCYIRRAGCWDAMVFVEMKGSWKVPQDTSWAVLRYLLTNDKVNCEKKNNYLLSV